MQNDAALTRRESLSLLGRGLMMLALLIYGFSMLAVTANGSLPVGYAPHVMFLLGVAVTAVSVAFPR